MRVLRRGEWAGRTLLVHQLESTRQLESQPPSSTSCGGASYGDVNVPEGQPGMPAITTAVTGFGGTPFITSVDLATLPVDVAISATGQWAIAAAGAQRVFYSPGGDAEPFEMLYSATPTAVAFSGRTLVTQIRDPSQLNFTDFAGHRGRVLLLAEPVASTAHDLFHTATASGLACASCHPEGRDDGHVWNLPEGPRRTNALLGGIKASAPFHWGGDRASMLALLDDVLVSRMGGATQSKPRSDALLDWLDQLPAMPLPDDLDALAVARGKKLFESPATRCSSCHSGALGTDNRNSDVGTGGLFQSPRLVGLASRAPYFHDGRIKRLADRFEATAGREAHGGTVSLTASDRADLVEYLRSR